MCILFKRFEEKLAVTPGAFTCIHTYVGSWEDENCYPLWQGAVYTSPNGGHQKFQGEGVPRGGNFHGDGVTFLDVFYSRDFETRIIVFIDDLTS